MVSRSQELLLCIIRQREGEKQSPHAANLVTIQDSSPHVLDKSALYSGSRLLLLRALQPQAAKPAATNSCEPPKVVRSPEQLLPNGNKELLNLYWKPRYY